MSYYREAFPQQRVGPTQFYIAAMQRWVLPRCAALITVSQHSRTEILKYLKVPPSRVHVVYHAPVAHPANEAAPSNPGPPDDPYILDVTSAAVHKNIPRLISAYARLRELMAAAPRLVIVGWIPAVPTWGMNSRQDLEECAAACGVADYVTIRPFVEDAELDSLYSRATLFVFPSLYEGFGHVVLEAMSRGIPTVVSNRASLPEVAGNATIYIDPTDEESIARGMLEGLTNAERRQVLIESGYGRVDAFGSWSRVAAETREVLALVPSRRDE